MKSLPTLLRRLATSALIAACLLLACAPTSFAQVIQWQPQGAYGVTGFKVNGELVASRFNYRVSSQPNVGGSFASFTQFPNGCAMDLGIPGVGIIPFNTNATVTVTDLSTSANTETVALNSVNSSAPNCTLSLATSNSHTGLYVLSSGTCGLQEARNYLGTAAGVIAVTQEWYDQGCTQSQLNVVPSRSNGWQTNQYIHDLTTGLFYRPRPTASSQIAAAGAPTMGTVAGGTWTNGNVIGCISFVDYSGNLSICNSNETTQATGGTTNGLTVTHLTPVTGEAGYLVGLTAVGGSTGTEIYYIPTATGATAYCTLTTLETVIPACAPTADFTALAPVTGTAKILPMANAYSTWAYEPNYSLLAQSPGNVGASLIPASFNVAAQGTVNGSAEDLAVLMIPAGYFNMGTPNAWQVCAKIATATQVASSVAQVKLLAATKYGQSPVQIGGSITFATQTMAAAGTIQGCWHLEVSTPGSSATFWSSTPTGPWTNTLNSTPAQTISSAVDVTTAVSSAVDTTKMLFLSLNFGETASHNITAPQALDFSISPATPN
jgi:hypothetical protein